MVMDATHGSVGADRASADGRPRSASYRPDVQGLRAVAVILVVAFHAGLPVDGGFVGVDMFFVISGFVIAGMIWRQIESPEGFSFRSFYTRRARRLLPALALTLVVVAVASTLFLSPIGPQQSTAKTGIAASLFSANLQLARVPGAGYFGLAADTNALLHTWSLSVEEQFYFVFPAFIVATAAACRRFVTRSRRHLVALVVGAAALVSFAVSYVASVHPTGVLDENIAFYSPVTRAWEFGAGVLLALLVPAALRLPGALRVAAVVAGGAMVAVAALTFSGATAFPGTAALLPVVGTALLIVAGTGGANPLTPLLVARPMVWIGDVSYGWYLWHWPLIVFAAALWPRSTPVLVVAGVAALVPTALSYRLLENPIRFDRSIRGRRVLAMAAICIATPVVAFLALIGVNKVERKLSAVEVVEAGVQVPVAHLSGCDDVAGSGIDPAEACRWTVDDPKGLIVLVGDSNAAQFAEPVIEAGNEAGYDVEVDTQNACPFVGVQVRTPALQGDQRLLDACDDWVPATLDRLRDEQPSLVIVAGSGPQYIALPGTIVDPTTGEEADDPEGRQRLWELGVRTVDEQLEAAEIPVVVVSTLPHTAEISQGWSPNNCAAIRMLTNSCERTTLARADVDEQQAAARQAEAAALAGSSAVVVDFTDHLCSSTECPTYRDGVLLHRDGSHVSVGVAKALREEIAGLVEATAVPRS